jgi:hypothetical protein
MRSVIRTGLLAFGTVLATSPLSTPAQALAAVPGPETRDGRADFNFEIGQRSVHYAGASDGELTVPLYGRFDGGRGEFLGDDTVGGRPIRVSFVISQIDADTARFEQAFSTDGGKTWEVNWIATDTRF